MLGPVLDALFPRRCAGCARGPWPFCEACRGAVQPLEPPWCRRCGSPALGDRATCPDCPPPPIHLARAAFRFHGPIRSATHRLKFSGWRAVAEALGDAMARAWEAGGVQDVPEVVGWVPLSRRRAAERGFDQARALAGVVGTRLDLPVRPLLARDGGDRATQARRDREERLAAMQGRFHARVPPPAHVLLVDDVLTTGATASACAEALVRAGAHRVDVLTAARALTPAPRRRVRSGNRDADILRDGLASGSVVARGIHPR